MKLAIVSVLIGLASLVSALPAPDLPTPLPGVTVTQCYDIVSTLDGGVIETPVASSVEYGIVDPNNPPSGVQCWELFQSGGGIEAVPLPTGPVVVVGTASNHNNDVIRTAVPIIAAVVGLLILIGGSILFMRLRARKQIKSTRRWTNRPGGWIDQKVSEPQPMELSPTSSKFKTGVAPEK
ncbi:hypothetical protein BDN72DRAFT_903282 [Pluteus cervinus]|uniref:Uncharacterized protein n=1 Tax=Pluteus cervinus TaxID=181527 RepID=A0ACD3AAD7_9AGAR|nr:hypothetical protein BDN72DRAFT_903282 [Pluteus cervinus]